MKFLRCGDRISGYLWTATCGWDGGPRPAEEVAARICKSPEAQARIVEILNSFEERDDIVSKLSGDFTIQADTWIEIPEIDAIMVEKLVK